MDIRTDLLKLLEKDCRATPDQLAAMLGESSEAVRSEIAQLEKNDVILGYNAMIDWDRTGEELVTALIEVRVTPQRGDGFDRIAERIYQFEEVESMYLMSGAYDFAVTITGRSLKDVASFVSARLSTIEGVIGTATHFILKKYKEKGVAFEVLPVQEERMKFC
jgi:DNA-binding Lrp family transcriptional regulator